MRVYRRGKRGTWWVDFTAPGGERFNCSTRTTDEAAAKEWAAAAYRDQWRQQRLGEAPPRSWDEAVLSWLDEHRHLRSIEEAKRNLRWLSDRLVGKPLASITADVVRRLSSERQAEPSNAAEIAAALREGKATPRPRALSPATVNRYLSDLSRILRHAQTRGWLAAPPPVPKLHEPQGRTTWITHEQARALLAELPEHLRAMARFALATGLRESNVRLLEWSQVDLSRAAAWVHADQAKAGRAIAVPLNADALDALQGQQGMHRAGYSRRRAGQRSDARRTSRAKYGTPPPARPAAPRGARPASARACRTCAGTTCATPGRAGTAWPARRTARCRNWAAGRRRPCCSATPTSRPGTSRHGPATSAPRQLRDKWPRHRPRKRPPKGPILIGWGG